MANEQDRNQNPTTGSESDISKAQSQQQPPAQANQNKETTGEQVEPGQQGDEAASGQAQAGAGPDEGLQGETATEQRTDVEGASLGSQERGEAESGFVGSQGREDTSSELVEDQEFEKDGQGAPEGK